MENIKLVRDAQRATCNLSELSDYMKAKWIPVDKRLNIIVCPKCFHVVKAEPKVVKVVESIVEKPVKKRGRPAKKKD